MLDKRTWEHICRVAEEVPTPCLKAPVRSEIVASLGAPMSEMFPQFARRMPLTTDRMEAFWSPPLLAFRQFRTKWLATLALEQATRNLFFDLAASSFDVEGPEFDKSHAMLPDGWKELYRWFWSFGITEDDFLGLYWKNTPFSYTSRLNGNSYRSKYGSGQGPQVLEEKVESNQLYCWLITDAGDTLWLDELRCDQKVYHVALDRFDEAITLSDPDFSMDAYLAHVVSGLSPSTFDFRRSSPVA